MPDPRGGDRRGDVLVARAGNDGVATVSLNRPPENYFDASLIADLAGALELLATDPSARAVVLRSEGRHFCAGAHLGGGVRVGSGEHETAHLYDEAARIFANPLPIVAALTGAAVGGGLGLALAADFRVGAASTRCSANFARLGFHHGFALTVTLPAIVGPQRANELLLTGARIGGVEAHRIGLLDRLVDDSDDGATVDAAAHELAGEIAASAPLAVQSIRATMRGDLAERAVQAMAHERRAQDRLRNTADFVEGVQAMAERRPPRFLGR